MPLRMTNIRVNLLDTGPFCALKDMQMNTYEGGIDSRLKRVGRWTQRKRGTGRDSEKEKGIVMEREREERRD